MPTISVKRDELFRRLEKEYTEDGFQKLCFEFGLELDEVTSEKQMLAKEQGDGRHDDASDEVIYKIDVPANRYDLLCVEGIARALRIFLGMDQMPAFRAVPPTDPSIVLNVEASTEAIRPHAVAAVLRGMKFTAQNYASFIELQEKLHQNLCRRRTLVAIGTHDLRTIKGPFVYSADAPGQIKFKPLRSTEDREYTAPEIMAEYRLDTHLRQYLPIIENSPVYPIIRDANGVVLSMPPIINGQHSKITLDTTDVFIECTATDLTKAQVTLNMLVTMMGEYTSTPFTVEQVPVVTKGQAVLYPTLPFRDETIDVPLMNKRIGIERTPADYAQLLTKMQLPSKISPANPQQLIVTVPPVRPDVLHACDIWEDAAIAHGYNNIVKTSPKVVTIGKQLPINKLTDQLRAEVAQAGYSEALTFALCSKADGFENLRRPDDGETAVLIANPKTALFQIARPNLLAGLLDTIKHNKKSKKPIKFFEISDVVLLDKESDTGARNERRLAAAIYSNSPGFEDIQGLLDFIMNNLGVPFVGDQDKPEEHDNGYYLNASADPAFFGELGAADVIYKGRRVGVLGVVHPEVLSNFQLDLPVGALELNLEEFL